MANSALVRRRSPRKDNLMEVKGNEEAKDLCRNDGRHRCDESPSRRKDHPAYLQNRSRATAQGGFEADPGHSQETALFPSRFRAQAADQRADAREVGTGACEAESSSSRARPISSEVS